MERTSRLSKGFTLIELMIVIAIVAILVSLAVPAYQDYSVRAKVAECISAAAVPKTQITEHMYSLGAWPSNLEAAGMSNLGVNISKYCSIYAYNNNQGDFYVRTDSVAVGIPFLEQIIPVFSQTVNGSGAVDWLCTKDLTTVGAMKFLPATCRGDNIF